MAAELSGTTALTRPVVDTAHGPVRGVDDGSVMAWKGIRYAAPPVGALRFQAPEPPRPWTEPVDAATAGPVCPQVTDSRSISARHRATTV